MKVRWTRNSLRLRITPSELAALLRGEPAGEEMRIAGGGTAPLWRVEIAHGAQAESLLLSCGAGLHLRLGTDDLRKLAEPEREGIYYSEGDFRWFVEKDFPCIHPRALEALEAPTETFVPPADFEARKASK